MEFFCLQNMSLVNKMFLVEWIKTKILVDVSRILRLVSYDSHNWNKRIVYYKLLAWKLGNRAHSERMLVKEKTIT